MSSLGSAPIPATPLPGVSYVMPVLNEVTHIRAAVASLLEQDYAGPMEVTLALGNVDHVRGRELSQLALDVYRDATLGQQGDVVEVMHMPFITVTGFCKVHLTQPQVADAGHLGFWVTHSWVTPISVGSDCRTPNLTSALATCCSNRTCIHICMFSAAAGSA